MNAFLLNSGEESIREALSQAKALGSMSKMMRGENRMLQKALEIGEISTAVMDRQGNLLRAFPEEVPMETCQVLKDHLGDALRTGGTQFYHQYGGNLYAVASKLLQENDEKVVCYSWKMGNVSQRIRTGVQNLGRVECEYQFTHSFYALSGAMGEMEGRVNAVAESR